MVIRRLPVICAVAVALLVGACHRTPRVAVIGMHGLAADTRYLDSFADSLMMGPHPVSVEVFDGGESGDAYRLTLERAEEIVKIPGLVAVVGHRDSRSTLVVGPVYRDAGVPLVVPNATSGAIVALGPQVFRMVADDREEGAFLAHLAVDSLKARTVMIFHLSDEYGIGIRDGILEALAGVGVTPVSVVEYGLHRLQCPGEFQALVDAALLKGAPDVVLLGSRTPDAACIVRLMGRRGPTTHFLAADGVDPGDDLSRSARDGAVRLWVTQFWSPLQDAASLAFARDYQRKSGVSADQGTALRWDAVRLLVQAVNAVGADRSRVAHYLRTLGNERPPFHGLTGEVSFGPHRHSFVVVGAGGRLVQSRTR